MPEGPEIKRSAEVLKSLIIGLYILDIKLSERALSWNIPLFKPEVQIIDVTSYGKKLFFHLDNGGYIASEYRMTGRWLQWEEKHVHVVLELGEITYNGKLKINEDIMTLYYDESRPFGGVSYLPDRKSYDNFVSDLGPDLLSGSVTIDVWRNRIEEKRYQNWQICKLLLEQGFVCGIGNYLKSDILYLAKIRPDRKVASLSLDEIDNLYYASIDRINNSFQNNGLTIEMFITPDGKQGLYQTLVYDRNVDNNGYKVIKEKFKDGRTTHYVPEIQK